MKTFSMLAAFAAMTAVAAPAAAQVTQYKAKDTVSVESGMAYVVIRTNLGTDLRLFKLVDEADRQNWEQDRKAAYDKLRKKYERQVENYERDIKDWNESAQARQLMRRKPVKPEEPSLEGTPVAPVEMANFVIVSRGRNVAEDAEKTRTFVIAVKPGTYVINGGVGVVGAYGSGSCYCMGTVAFEAPAGQVVDAGTVKATVGADFYRPVDFIPPPAAPSIPTQLNGHSVAPAKLIAAGKMANFFGTPVTRLNPVPGILGYNRDIPLDIAAGNAPVEAIR